MNVLDLVAGLKLLGKRIILGYSSHQMLVAGCAGADAIASGTFMNVRAFPPEKFFIPPEEDTRKLATWYYCPQTYSEFKLYMLDLARKMGILGKMAPQKGFDEGYSKLLFGGAQPSTVGFKQGLSFRHYLSCLWTQARAMKFDTFDSSWAFFEKSLSEADKLLDSLHKVGIQGEDRDFRAASTATFGALQVLKKTRGAMLRRRWKSL